jgi:hypothetical protein
LAVRAYLLIADRQCLAAIEWRLQPNLDWGAWGTNRGFHPVAPVHLPPPFALAGRGGSGRTRERRLGLDCDDAVLVEPDALGRRGPSVTVLERAVRVPGVGDRVVDAKHMGALDDVSADRVVAVMATASDRVDRVVEVFGVGDGIGPVG